VFCIFLEAGADMGEWQSWRDLLGELTSDSIERQRIASAIGINPVTLTRWVGNKSSPRIDNMRQLLDVLPQRREQLFALMQEEFPDLAIYEQEPIESIQEIPPAFYARVMNAFASSPPILRAPTITSLIRQQLIVHFDPNKKGIIAAIAQCMPPAPGQKVRSLRQVTERTSWEDRSEQQTLFLGAESQAGRAVMIGSPIIVQSLAEKERRYAIRYEPEEGSIATCPIMKADSTAGCLYVFVSRPNYFTSEHAKLVQSYANLLILGFEESEFYSLSEIDLGMMPPLSLQMPHFSDFQMRVTRYMLQEQAECGLIIRPQAEQIIWKQIENELLHLPFSEFGEGMVGTLSECTPRL
jgi:hypothetical protein